MQLLRVLHAIRPLAKIDGADPHPPPAQERFLALCAAAEAEYTQRQAALMSAELVSDVVAIAAAKERLGPEVDVALEAARAFRTWLERGAGG